MELIGKPIEEALRKELPGAGLLYSIGNKSRPGMGGFYLRRL